MYDTETPNLKVGLTGGRLDLVLDRPPGNTIDYAMLEGITRVCREAAVDPDVRVLVLAGAGEVFSIGDDPAAMGAWPDRFSHRRPRGSHGPGPLPEQDAICALREFMKPTIALLRGPALGLAMDLAAVCDLRIAASSAEIGDPRVREGRAAATGISYVLPRLIGQSQATRILLLGERLSAAEAHRIHLVHEVIDDAGFADAAAAKVAAIAALPTRAWEVHKLQVLPQLDLGFDAAMTHSLGIRQTHVIEDRAEAQLARREKRPPKFTGR